MVNAWLRESILYSRMSTVIMTDGMAVFPNFRIFLSFCFLLFFLPFLF
jgi:hypothetical protein